MKLSGLLELSRGSPALCDLIASLENGHPPNEPLGLYHSARPYAVALLAHALNRPLLIVTARSNRALQWVEELRVWLPDGVPVHWFADPDALPYERIAWAPETRQRRLEALVGLTTSQDARGGAPAAPQPIVVTSARGLIQMTLPLREMRAALRVLQQGQSFDLEKALASWVGLGYESAAIVETPGEFCRRGGIVDIWPPNLRTPIRIELFGDEIDSLRTFDPSTQRTLSRIEQAWIGPASEALPKVGPRVTDRLRALDLGRCHPPARMEYERELALLGDGSGSRNLEWYIPYLYSQPASILNHVPASGLTFLDDAAEVMSTLADLAGQAEQLARDLGLAGDIPDRLIASHFVPADTLAQFTHKGVVMLGSSTLKGWADSERPVLASSFAAGPRFGGQVRTAVGEIQSCLRSGSTVVAVTRQALRLAELCEQAGHAVVPVQGVLVPPLPGLTIVQGELEEGWVLRHDRPGEALMLLTDAELFGWGKPRARRVQRSRAVTPEVFFADVRPGDLVVHLEHGVGRFRGLTKLAFEGSEREYLQVDYARLDQLYVPVHQADRLARYVGTGEVEPALHRLGTSDWEQLKARTKKAVAEIAEELLELYAAREVVHGHAFSADAPWQAELESSFPYVETEDQLVAIESVKHDMERARPMDRLICGDVGYGKTEVALRAAFKAIMDNMQVALLVPTTVLAQQHFTNFNRRLASFPVTVAMLSRFQRPAEQQKTLEGLVSGKVDLVIGTHRLLSKDVVFKDLGLLIVDEEQRFGVGHKERIKQMRTEVDVLTLTATPIPRTLHLSLTGVRDLSTIDTPPEERLPIKTIIAEFDETIVRQSILRELDRNGQVYYVHNRVQGIEQMAARVAKIVPEARVAIAHGQMPEKELSSVMLAFAEGDTDVLVCTSIIESGLDIPNANTIIINRSDQFGLAQLYQLRGRVGRSSVRAYAYLLVDKYKTLTEDARRRLEAIEEASELGAGFRIAMQDLEIRGAGELLGARQSGHIAAVGFDLYARLLALAVHEARQRQPGGLPAPRRTEEGDENEHGLLDEPIAPTVTLDLGIPASIPDTYVLDSSLRLQLYRRLARLTTLLAIEEMGKEFSDRFGPVPVEVEDLLYVVQVKVTAINAGIDAISLEDEQLVIKAERLELMERSGLQAQLQGNDIPARVARRAIWLPMRQPAIWRGDLIRTLDIVRLEGEKVKG